MPNLPAREAASTTAMVSHWVSANRQHEIQMDMPADEAIALLLGRETDAEGQEALLAGSFSFAVTAAGGDVLLCNGTRVEVGRQTIRESIAMLVDSGAGAELAEVMVEQTIDAMASVDGLRPVGDGLVEDSAGGVWRPNLAALGVICEAGVHRFNEALRLCLASPMAGTWHN